MYQDQTEVFVLYFLFETCWLFLLPSL